MHARDHVGRARASTLAMHPGSPQALVAYRMAFALSMLTARASATSIAWVEAPPASLQMVAPREWVGSGGKKRLQQALAARATVRWVPAASCGAASHRNWGSSAS